MSENFVIVTTSWDDGHKLDLETAKLLKKYNLQGTFYVSPKNREWDKKYLLTDSEVKKLSKDFEIGGHTITHPVLTQVPLKEAYKEIKDSKTYLEKILNKEVKMFAYTKGMYNEDVKKLVKKAGFLGGRTIKAFRTSVGKDFFEMETTNHTVNREIWYSLALALYNNPRFIPHLFSTNWLDQSKGIFDVVLKNGGIFHFWSHSWQVNDNGWWGDLEKLFKYISGRPGVLYLSNQEVLEYIKKQKRANFKSTGGID